MYYMDFDTYMVRQRNKEMQREIHSLRLEKQLRQEHGSSGSRYVALVKRGVMPLLRAAHAAR